MRGENYFSANKDLREYGGEGCARPLAERFLRRASDVCGLNARQIMRGDRGVLDAIHQWRTATA